MYEVHVPLEIHGRPGRAGFSFFVVVFSQEKRLSFAPKSSELQATIINILSFLPNVLVEPY